MNLIRYVLVSVFLGLSIPYCLHAQRINGHHKQHFNGIDITVSRVIPYFNKPQGQDFLMHESITYSIVAGERIRALAGINFLFPAKDGVTRYGFHAGILAGSTNPVFGMLYGSTFFHIINKRSYDNGALRNYHNTGISVAVGCYYVPFDRFVFSTKIAPALYHYNFKKINDIPVIDGNADTRSETFYVGFYQLLSFSIGYRF